MPRANDPELVAERRRMVITLTRQGVSASQIADRIGVRKRSVTRIRSAAGIAQSGGSPMTGRELLRARALLDDGASYHEVARTLGRPARTVERHLPGYRKMTPAEASQAAALGRELARLERAPNLQAPQHRKGKAA